MLLINIPSNTERRVRSTVKINLESKVTELPGCGSVRASKLMKLGIEKVSDLLRHFPRGYQNRGDVKSIADAPLGEVSSFVLTVTTPAVSVRLRGGKVMTKCKAFDGETSCTLIFFNQNYIKNVLKKDLTYRFYGKLTKGKYGYELSPSSVEPVNEAVALKKLIPVYPITAGLSQNIITGMVSYVLSQISENEIVEIIPDEIREKAGICGVYDAYKSLHQPKDTDMLERGRERFIFEELLTFALSVSMAGNGRKNMKGIKFVPEKSKLYNFIRAIPFELTKAQAKVISETRKDMTERGYPMARLISGDVGSGKTVCAAAAAYISLNNGYQCAMMAPTEILARQHYRDFCELFGKLDIECGFLSGSLSAAEKKKIYSRLESGELRFIVGTHALLSEGVKFSNLGLVITDEQHRFGVMQRAKLTGKSEVAPHVLVMSATPIPRTLALILCGDLDISVIDEMPPGRKKVDTAVIHETDRKRMYNFLEKQIKAGRQIYIVCPMVESQSDCEEEITDDFINLGFEKNKEKLPALKSAIEYEELLRTGVFSKYRTAFIHGKMNGKEKDAIMQAFSAGEIDVLVSTTVIEVGVNVPNATVMVVENAERFGLSQLHQLRGRVGRGKEKSYCILMSDAKGENAQKRLQIMKTESSGYKIAEYDLEMRGPGDFMSIGDQGLRQHGKIGFKMAGLCTDTLMLSRAFEIAEEIVSADPLMERREYSGLKKAVSEINGMTISAIN